MHRLLGHRLFVVAAVFALAYLSVAVRLLDMTKRGDVAELAAAAVEEGPKRARPDVVDRTGKLLATDLRVASVYGDPGLMRDPRETAYTLATVLKDIDLAISPGEFFAAARARSFSSRAVFAIPRLSRSC